MDVIEGFTGPDTVCTEPADEEALLEDAACDDETPEDDGAEDDRAEDGISETSDAPLLLSFEDTALHDDVCMLDADLLIALLGAA